MRAQFLIAAALGLAAAAPSFAQPKDAPETLPPKLPAPAEMPTPPQPPASGLNLPTISGLNLPTIFDQNFAPPMAEPRVWFTTDYLLWWVKGQNISQPLITVGSPNDLVPNALGQPNTRVLFGDNTVDYGAQSGFRFTLGGWLNNERTWGLEASGFFLLSRSSGVAFSSDANGNPALGQPVINPNTGEEAYSTSLQGSITGSIWATTSSELSGWEIDGLCNITRGCNGEINFLLGFRQLTLRETLQVSSDITALGGCVLTFDGTAIGNNDHIFTTDRFVASTNFYGPQIGGVVGWSSGRFGFDVVGKLGLGVSQEQLQVSGYTAWIPVSGPVVSNVGGILAQTTNIGNHFHEQFAVLPELNLNFYCDLAPWARLGFGYTFLYLSNALRPGLTIDRTVDPARVPSDQSFGTTAIANRPGVVMQDTGFWAQGLNFTVMLRY
jgi:Putative beta barrel porin-7 (BBP7)